MVYTYVHVYSTLSATPLCMNKMSDFFSECAVRYSHWVILECLLCAIKVRICPLENQFWGILYVLILQFNSLDINGDYFSILLWLNPVLYICKILVGSWGIVMSLERVHMVVMYFKISKISHHDGSTKTHSQKSDCFAVWMRRTKEPIWNESGILYLFQKVNLPLVGRVPFLLVSCAQLELSMTLMQFSPFCCISGHMHSMNAR